MGSIPIAHRFRRQLDLDLAAHALARNARETRSCSATSQTIVRRPVAAAAIPSEAATVVLPTPPLPVT